MDERVVRDVNLAAVPVAAAAPERSEPLPRTRFECKVCWYVYDPAAGDAVWQVAPGTPFAALPDHWSCPQCSTTRDQFLVLHDD